MKAIRRQGLFIDAFVGDWPTNSNNVLQDDGLAASTTTPNDELCIKGFDFTSIPTTAQIKGIEVTINGYMTDPGGGSQLQLAAKLSKTGGTSFTGSRKTPFLTLSEKNYVVGGPLDLWGAGSWSWSDLLYTSGFAVTIASFEKSSTPTPTYFAEFMAVTVYYNDVDAVNDIPTEPLFLTETVVASITAVAVNETVAVTDGLLPTGSATTAWRTSANFAARAGIRQRREAAGVRLHIGPAIFYIGDTLLLTKANGQTETAVPMSMMQPGLIAVGEIERRGDYGEASEYDTASVRLTNRKFADQSGAGSNAKMLAEWFRGVPRAAKSMTVWAFVDAGDGWQNRVLFDGLIEEVNFTESESEILAIQVGTGPTACPNLIVDSTSFTYEPGSSAADTGEEIPGSRGKVIPVGIGRFDLTAVKAETSFASGHPFRFSPGQAGVAAAAKVYSNAATFPALWGVLFPMMPTIWAARNFRRKNSQASGVLDFTSWPYQNVFLFGTRNAAPALGVMQGTSVTSPRNFLCPGDEWNSQSGGLDGFGNDQQSVQYVDVWTWRNDKDRDYGIPFIRDWTSRNLGAERILQSHSAGSMDNLGWPGRIFSNWTDGTANRAYGVFVNANTPKFTSYFSAVKTWMGLTQAVALPMEGLTKKENLAPYAKWRQRGSAEDPPLIPGETGSVVPWVKFQTDDSPGQIDNPFNCMKLEAYEDTTRINAGYFLSMQCPTSGPNLGKMLGIRFWVLWNNVTSTATTLYGFSRFGLLWQRGFGPANNVKDIQDWNSTYDPDDITVSGNQVQAIKWTISANRAGGSMWLIPFWLVNTLEPNIISDATKPTHPKYFKAAAKAEWEFASWDLNNPPRSPSDIIENPWDVMLHVKSGGGFADIVACWMEVIYQSKLENSGPMAYIRPIIEDRIVHQGHFPYRAYGGTAPGPKRGPAALTYLSDDDAAETLGEVFVTGRGLIDRNGELTGTSNTIVEKPADVANTIIRHYLGSDVFSSRAGGIVFGGFGSSRLILGSYRGSYVFDTAGTVRDALDKIANQSLSFIRQQIDDNGNLVWRMFTEVADPDSEYPELLYRTNGYGFRWDDLIADSFRASQSPLQELSSNIRVRYGFHRPSKRWSNEKYCTDDSNNFTTSGAAYQAALLDVRNGYGIENPIVLDAPDIWDPDSAEVLCKWACDRLRRRRIQVEFETFANGLDLVPGHVITFADEIGDRVKWPGESSGEWSTKRFNVTRVFPRRDDRRPWIVKVTAIETITRAA